MNIILKENETMQDLVERLADSFRLVYDIAPVAYWYENLYENGRIKDIHFSPRMRELLGYSSVEEFPDELNTLLTFTHPEDVHIMLNGAIDAGTGKTDKYDVQYRIRRADGRYMWCNATGELVKDSRGVTVGMYGAFIDITEEIELQKKQVESVKLSELISGFARECEAVFIGNLNTRTFKTLEDKAGIAAEFAGVDSLGELIEKYIGKYVHPLDAEKFDPDIYHAETAAKKLTTGKPYVFEYRTVSSGDYLWYRATFNRINIDEVLIGFRNCNEEIIAKTVNEKLINEYDAIYIAELEGGIITPVRSSRVSKVGELSKKTEYTPMVLRFAETVAPQYRQDWIAFSDTAFMKKYMAKENHREYVYELPEAAKHMRRFSVDVLERRNGEASTVLFSFMGIDDDRAAMIRLNRKLAEQQRRYEESDRIINALSMDFDCVNYVGIQGNKAQDITVSVRTSALLEHLIPGWEQEKSFTKKLEMLYDTVVYEPDRKQFYEATRRETVIDALARTDSYYVSTRFVIDGEPRHFEIQLTAMRDGNNITGVVAGIRSVDERMKRELEQREALQETNAKLAEQSAFTTYFLEPYISAYYIGLDDLTCRIYKRTKKLENDYPIITNYLDSVNEYIDREIHPDDREKFRELIRPAKMKELLLQQPEFTYVFRTLTDGTEKYLRFRAIRGADETHAAFGFVDVTEELAEQRRHILGAVPLSPDILAKANIGMWSFELDEGKPPRMYVDDTMLRLIGLEHQVSPEETYHAWYDNIDDSSYGLVAEAVEKMTGGVHAEVQYPWHYPDGRTIVVRCGGTRNSEYKAGIRIEGTHQDVTETIRYDEAEIERLRMTEVQLQHEQLRSEVLNYMVDHDDDPIELLKSFAERLRSLINCDQVIYRDLEETRIMVNSDSIADTWSVPIEYCRQCEHFDAHHPMYAAGYTEMDNCQEGWQGIPVYHDCPIKSSLTRIVYCDGEIAGYLAIHYVQNYHHFTDIERSTLEEFTRILSMSLSRYVARKRAGELDSVKHTLNMMFSLSDRFDPIIVVDPVTGEYDWMMSVAEDVTQNTSMTLHGEDLYKNIGIDSAAIIHEEDREQFKAFYTKENMMQIADTGESQETENRWFIQTDGRYRWKYNKAVRMIDDNGKALVVVGVIDTTDEKDEEERLSKQKKLMEQQQALSDGLAREYHTVWLVEGTGEHRLHLFRSTGKKTVQRAVQRGLDEPTYDGTMVKYVMDSVHEDDRKRVLEESKFETVERETPDVGTYVISYKRYCDDEGNIDYHQMCFAKAVAEDGTVNYILAFRDADKMIREQIAQQKQLEEALSMAQSASRAKTTFLNNMSHDIRTPMNAIIGYTGLAASHIDNKQQVQDYLAKISQSSDHLLSLINDVLDMSRIESGKMNLDEKEENLSDIIHTLRDIVQADIHSKRLDFFVDAVDVNDEDIICDKLRLNQVLLNILSNSIKYTAAGGTVTMRVTEKEIRPNGYAKYEFCIKDNGMGMDKEFLETIFDPFTRVRSSTVSGIQGTGLGMAITKNIVDMMGGSISVQSEPCRGTETRICFDFKLQSAPKEPEEIPELKGVRALVADDDSTTCLSICDMVRDIGMRYEWCTSGKEAVIRAEAAHREGDSFKVYIVDWIMPDMNGIETTRRIRKVVGDDIPIIILTAYDWSDIEDEAREAGVTAFVSKPMFPSDLHRVLNSCLGKEDEKVTRKESDYNFNGKKVLLVEDNGMNREIASEILEEEGFIIDTAEDGDIAVEKMKSANTGDYDIILMDVQMPRMDGYEATKQIRALGTEISKIPILAMTANAFEEDRKAALSAGMDEHIAKPIDIETLKETLAKFL